MSYMTKNNNGPWPEQDGRADDNETSLPLGLGELLLAKMNGKGMDRGWRVLHSWAVP